MSRNTDERLDKVELSLRELVHEAELLKTVLIVKEPESTVAAGAFDGLRKQIVAVAQERWAHLAQVAQIDAAVNHVSEVSELRTIAQQWLEQAGIRKLDGPTSQEHVAQQFEFVGQGTYVVETINPAYIDTQTGRVVKQGVLRLGEREAEPSPPASSAESETSIEEAQTTDDDEETR